ncbi:MAG: hypothetical protein Q8K75_11315 [Chlamydiales bacterium]|nr:hypothetical protein [Chlamydiales bacterium]
MTFCTNYPTTCKALDWTMAAAPASALACGLGLAAVGLYKLAGGVSNNLEQQRRADLHGAHMVTHRQHLSNRTFEVSQCAICLFVAMSAGITLASAPLLGFAFTSTILLLAGICGAGIGANHLVHRLLTEHDGRPA